MRISDWSSDVCSSDLDPRLAVGGHCGDTREGGESGGTGPYAAALRFRSGRRRLVGHVHHAAGRRDRLCGAGVRLLLLLDHSRRFSARSGAGRRSEEHTSELQSLMRISYAVFCLKKKKKENILKTTIVKEVDNRYNIR